MENNHFDVVVVGAGPAGLVTAAEIARTGASVAVLESRTGGPLSRAGTVLPRALELFDARGVADRLVRRTCEVNPHPFTTEHIWAGLHPVDWSNLDSRFGFTLYLAQSETESVLREWALEVGAQLFLGHEVQGVIADGDVVRVFAVTEGQEVQFTADYVVGADGARGVTRKSSGIGMEGFDGTFTGVAVIADMPFPFEGGYLSVTNERGWMLSFPFGQGLTRMGIVHAEGRTVGRDVPVTKEEIERYASDILGRPLEIPAIMEANRYTNARRIASTFRKNRVLLVGEALRSHYPASGVGMNFCIQDAFNLGWKLAAVIAGDADDTLLDTYETERRPVNERLLDSVDAQVSVQFNFSREAQTFLSRFQSRLIHLPDVTKQLQDELQGIEEPYPRAEDALDVVGRPIPDFDIMLTDGTSVRLYERLREGGAVVVDISNPRVVDAAALENAGVPFVAGHAIRRPSRLGDATVLVVRPDTYVGWAGTATATTEDVLRAVKSSYATAQAQPVLSAPSAG